MKFKNETITLTVKIDTKISFWQALKLRMIGIAIPKILKALKEIVKAVNQNEKKSS